MEEIKRLVIPGDDQGPDRIAKALDLARSIAKESAVEEIVFMVPTRSSLDSGSLHSLLGPKVHKAFIKGTAVEFSGLLIRCETMKTLNWLNKRTVVIAVYASQNMMDKIDGLNNLAAVVAVPWTATAIENWQRTWSAQILGQAASVASPLVKDQVVAQALKSLTILVNREHDILHPNDVEHAKRILRILRSRDHSEPTENLRLWAIKNGWRPKAAEALEALAQKAFTLRTKPKLDNPEHAEQQYRRWCDAAGQ